jgi:hypothetical protein
MRELHDIVTSLVKADGSCRDVNFEGPSWDGVTDLLRSLEASFQECSATDQEGRELTRPLAASVLRLARDGGFVYLIFGLGSGIIKRFQVFVSAEEDGSPFIEFSFYPNDVERTQELRRDFIEWADAMQRHLRARRYFARYENASWRFGDTSSTSGVFLVSDEIGTDA